MWSRGWSWRGLWFRWRWLLGGRAVSVRIGGFQGRSGAPGRLRRTVSMDLERGWGECTGYSRLHSCGLEFGVSFGVGRRQSCRWIYATMFVFIKCCADTSDVGGVDSHGAGGAPRSNTNPVQLTGLSFSILFNNLCTSLPQNSRKYALLRTVTRNMNSSLFPNRIEHIHKVIHEKVLHVDKLREMQYLCDRMNKIEVYDNTFLARFDLCDRSCWGAARHSMGRGYLTSTL